jgi:PII-like signaling protein
MKRQEPARRIRIYIDANDQWHGKPLYAAIVQEARKRGMAGATVTRGIMEYGAHSAVHEPHLWRITSDLPVVVEIVDSDAKVREFMPSLDEHAFSRRDGVRGAGHHLRGWSPSPRLNSSRTSLSTDVPGRRGWRYSCLDAM